MNELDGARVANPQTAEPSFALTGAGRSERGGIKPLGLMAIGAWALIAVAAMHVAYTWSGASLLIFVYLFALAQMARASTWRQAFYGGLGVGMLVGVLHLGFFWRIFSGGAAALWIVFAFWIGLFVALARLCLQRGDAKQRFQFGWLVVPFLWCGIEYFRSELYYLRFAWLSPGFAFGESRVQAPLAVVGTYGVGFLGMCLTCFSARLWEKSVWKASVLLVAGAGVFRIWGALPELAPPSPAFRSVRVAAVQMEFPTEKEVLVRLNEVVRKHPEAELIVLSEYTFSDPVPEKVLKWCREQRRYLIVGGKDPISKTEFYNTAFVISAEGEIVFRQVKSVPIQFFKDGLPAPEQKVWNSPWGKIGICICYDLSYSRVTDRLVKLGAEVLVVPTMDVIDWGEQQHKLHARVTPVRAAEYGVPIFRVASSGVSQMIDNRGSVLASSPCPGDGAIIAGVLEFRGPGHIPPDRWLVLFALAVTGLMMVASTWKWLSSKVSPRCPAKSR